jgi:hypothetical protein
MQDVWWTGGRYDKGASFTPQLIIIPPLFHTRLSKPSEVCDSLDQAELYHLQNASKHLLGFRVNKFL